MKSQKELRTGGLNGTRCLASTQLAQSVGGV